MKLRPYQNKLVVDLRNALIEGTTSIVAVLGCGGGKTIIQAYIAKSATNKGNSVLYLVHNNEIISQTKSTFKDCGVDMSLCNIMTIQTYRNRLTGEYSIIITDEAHRFMEAYKTVFEKHPNAIKIGFTATPIRLGTGGLGELFNTLVKSVSTRWLINNKYLSDFRHFSFPLVNTDKIHIKRGEFNQKEVEMLMENKAVYSGTINKWIEYAKDKKTIIYAASVKSSVELVQQFKQMGYQAEHLDGKTNKDIRFDIIDKFKKGQIQILSNYNLFSEGLDIPTIECVVLLRPTMSLHIYIQQGQRGLRYLDGKICIILDLVGNVYRHGTLDSIREWSLEHTSKNNSNEVVIRECENCFSVYSSEYDVCPYCGVISTKQVETKNKKTVEVDLVEVRAIEEIRNTNYSDLKANTWEELEKIRKAKGYKLAWALRYAKNKNIHIPHKYRGIMIKLKI